MQSSNTTGMPASAALATSAPTCPAGDTATRRPNDPESAGSPDVVAKVDKIQISLCGLGPYLRDLAARKGTTPSRLIRTELSRMAKEEGIDLDVFAQAPAAGAHPVYRVEVGLSSVQALTLASRATAAGVAKCEYLRALLDGDPPPALPPDHAALISALMASTDRLAAASVDLNALMRLLKSLPSTQVDGQRTSLQSLTGDIQAHLEVAAAVLAAVKVRRRQT